MKTLAWMRWIGVIALVAAVVLASPVHGLAANGITIGEATVRSGETHSGDLSMTVGELTIDGDVTGEVRNDLGSIVIRGTVGRNAVSSVGEIRVEQGGRVAGDVRTSAGEIVIRGDVGGRVISSAGEISIRGRVGDDVELEAGEVTISGEVGGDVRVRKGVVRLQSGAVVRGGVYVEEGWVDRSSGASAAIVEVRREVRDFGNTLFRFGSAHWPVFDHFDWFDGIWLSNWSFFSGFGRIGRALVILLLGMAALALLPERVRRMAEYATHQPGHSLGFGLLGVVAMPVVIFLLVISILGIIVVPFAIVAMALVWLLAHIVAGLALGRAVAARIAGPEQEPWHEFAQLGLGLLILAVLGFVPIVGWIASAAATLVGLGAVIASRLGQAARDGAPAA